MIHLRLACSGTLQSKPATFGMLQEANRHLWASVRLSRSVHQRIPKCSEHVWATWFSGGRAATDSRKRGSACVGARGFFGLAMACSLANFFQLAEQGRSR